MRPSTASIILAFCALLAVQAAPANVNTNGAIAAREVDLADALMVRDLPLEARAVELEDRDPKKWVLLMAGNRTYTDADTGRRRKRTKAEMLKSRSVTLRSM